MKVLWNLALNKKFLPLLFDIKFIVHCCNKHYYYLIRHLNCQAQLFCKFQQQKNNHKASVKLSSLSFCIETQGNKQSMVSEFLLETRQEGRFFCLTLPWSLLHLVDLVDQDLPKNKQKHSKCMSIFYIALVFKQSNNNWIKPHNAP